MKAIDRYHKWVEWSDEDGVYIGSCPDLITGIHGDDPVQVHKELCEVIAAVIKGFESRRQPLPGPSSEARVASEVNSRCLPLNNSGHYPQDHCRRD